MNKPLIAILVLLSVSATCQAAPFAKGNVETGNNTFEQHKCNSCHVSMLGGDGSEIFTRADRKVKNPASLATQITRCSTNLGLMLFEDDEENVGAYLNSKYYKFK
jgi:cytochrome c peroxidase